MSRPLSPNEVAIYLKLEAVANSAGTCPTNDELIVDTSLKASRSVPGVLKRLEQLGHIQVHVFANSRAITICKTGKTTRKTARDSHAVAQRRAALPVTVPTPRPQLPPRVFRDLCPCCGTRMDADPALCCARGRAIRKLVA